LSSARLSGLSVIGIIWYYPSIVCWMSSGGWGLRASRPSGRLAPTLRYGLDPNGMPKLPR
jgi:hypothetical protein